VKGRRSGDTIWAIPAFQPLSIIIAAIVQMEPHVKDSANFDGAMTSIGRKRKNARKKNTAAPQRSAAKYTKSVPEGIRKLHRSDTVGVDGVTLQHARSVNH
jgi:hypothetical protein